MTYRNFVSKISCKKNSTTPKSPNSKFFKKREIREHEKAIELRNLKAQNFQADFKKSNFEQRNDFDKKDVGKPKHHRAYSAVQNNYPGVQIPFISSINKLPIANNESNQMIEETSSSDRNGKSNDLQGNNKSFVSITSNFQDGQFLNSEKNSKLHSVNFIVKPTKNKKSLKKEVEEADELFEENGMNFAKPKKHKEIRMKLQEISRELLHFDSKKESEKTTEGLKLLSENFLTSKTDIHNPETVTNQKNFKNFAKMQNAQHFPVTITTNETRKEAFKNMLEKTNQAIGSIKVNEMPSKIELATIESNKIRSKMPQLHSQKDSGAQFENQAKLSNSNLKGSETPDNDGTVLSSINYTKTGCLTPREILEMNPEISERTVGHIWHKFLNNEVVTNFDQIIPSKRALKLTVSTLGHLDSIHKIEWIQTETALFLVSFSDDALIKQWKLDYKDGNNVTTLHNQNSPTKKMSSEFQEIKQTAELKNQTSYVNRIPTFLKGSFSNLDAIQVKKMSLRKTANYRFHSAPIFSSSIFQKPNELIKLFSGDSKGNVNCFNFIDDKLKLIKTIKTGSEPCWALAAMDHSTLITSTPNKVKAFNVNCTASKQKEEFMFCNNKSFFGHLKKFNDTSFLVNSYSNGTLKNEFILFDLIKQKEANRMVSTRVFSNSFAYVPQNNLVYSANEDKTVSLYDVRERRQTDFFCAHSDSVMSIDICFDKNLFVTAGADSSIRIWDLRNLRILDELKGHRKKNDDSIFEVRFDPMMKVIGSCGAEGALKIFHF